MAGVYGLSSLLGPGGLNYEIYCGLWFNLPRVRLQKSWDFKTGMGMSHTRSPLPRSVYDAQAVTPELAEVLQWSANRKLLIAKQRALLRF